MIKVPRSSVMSYRESTAAARPSALLMPAFSSLARIQTLLWPFPSGGRLNGSVQAEANIRIKQMSGKARLIHPYVGIARCGGLCDRAHVEGASGLYEQEFGLVGFRPLARSRESNCWRPA